MQKRIGSACLFMVLFPAVSSADLKHTGTVTLDQFHDVVFELFSPTTFSLNLLQAKNKFSSTDLVFGGGAEGDLQNWQGDPIFIINPLGYYHKSTVLYFSQATLDVMMNSNPWTTIFLSATDSAIGQSGPNANYYYLPRALVLFGNVEKFPLFLTAGINTIPFGQFLGAGVWNRPLTTSYFFPQQTPQVSLGFHNPRFCS
jgi:hypothetical protein